MDPFLDLTALGFELVFDSISLSFTLLPVELPRHTNVLSQQASGYSGVGTRGSVLFQL